MTKLKCPFCNEIELEKGIKLQGGGFILGCPKCKKFAHDIFWKALIDTKKKLDDEKQHEKIMAEAIQHNLETEQRLVQECVENEKKLEYVGMILKNLLPHLNGYEKLDVQKALEQIKNKE